MNEIKAPPISDKASPIALKIARGIFKSGDEPNSPCQRIQFKGGFYPHHETDNGGFCEFSLAENIERTLKPELDLLNRVAEAAEALFKAELAAYGVVSASNQLYSALESLKQFRAEGGK
jgi:hypothetical protein